MDSLEIAGKFKLATVIPKTVLESDKTLKQYNLVPNGNLIVEMID